MKFNRSEKMSKNESENAPKDSKPVIPLIKKKMMRFPRALYDAIEAKAIQEKDSISNLNAFICDLIRRGLKYEQNQPYAVDLETAELLESQKQLFEEEKNFFNQISQIFSVARQEEKPDQYEEKVERILKAIGKQKLSFQDLAQITHIQKSELIVILANLTGEDRIGFDERFNYYAI